MSRNLETYTVRAEMINDLINCYREIAPECITQNVALERTVIHKAKRFYITPKQVCQRISKYINGCTETIEQLKPLQQQLFYDIMHVIVRLQKDGRYKKRSLFGLCKVAVRQPAPRFYISARQFRAILSEYLKGGIDEYGRFTKSVKLWEDPKHREMMNGKRKQYHYIQ